MSFRPNRELELGPIGQRLRLTREIRVLKGEFAQGSIVELEAYPDPNDQRQEFKVRDIESGETLYLTSLLGGYEQV